MTITFLINWSTDQKQQIDVLFILFGRTTSAKRLSPKKAHEWINAAIDMYSTYNFEISPRSDKDAVEVVLNN